MSHFYPYWVLQLKPNSELKKQGVSFFGECNFISRPPGLTHENPQICIVSLDANDPFWVYKRRQCFSTQNNQSDHNSIHKTKEQTALCGTAIMRIV